MDNEAIVKAAVWVVNMFDQANTNNAVVNLGSRGFLLKQAIEELRPLLNADMKRTILDSDQAKLILQISILRDNTVYRRKSGQLFMVLNESEHTRVHSEGHPTNWIQEGKAEKLNPQEYVEVIQ